MKSLPTEEQLVALMAEFKAPVSVAWMIRENSVIGNWIYPILMELRDKRLLLQREPTWEELDWKEK